MDSAYEVDLHVHTTASDGQHSPSEVVRKAKEKGIRVLAISDHDTVGGIKEGVEAGIQWGVEVVPAIELSTRDEPEKDFFELHLLGYYINADHSHLQEKLEQVQRGRREQKRMVIRRLQDLGFEVPEEEVFALAAGAVPGSLHVFEVVKRHNGAGVRGGQEFYEEYLGFGGKAHVPRPFELSLEEAIQEVLAIGGVPILAHPGAHPKVRDPEGVVCRATEYGLRGIEVHYPYDKNHPYEGKAISKAEVQAIVQRFARLADKRKLLKTGGSDFHGNRKPISLGEMGMTYQDYLQFKDRCGRHENCGP